jgi:light-regulated signal transduction histidine kinase (bacteriophytochrome)
LGEVYAIVNVVHDVTELIKKTEELKDLNEILAIRNKELQQKNEEITNFSFVASHDMKEPLRKIHTFSDWILENDREHLSSTGIDYLNRLQSSVKRMERLIDDIQVLMKVHSDTQHFQDVDLSGVIEEVIKDLEETYTDFETEVSPLPSIVANRNQLFLLCRNLIQNSIKFRNPGTIARINVISQMITTEETPDLKPRAGKYLRLSIADDGPGINEKYFIKIFQVFQQLPGEEVFSGTGMGLAICRKIMENHGGYIRLESEEGKGTVFHCYFPVT